MCDTKNQTLHNLSANLIDLLYNLALYSHINHKRYTYAKTLADSNIQPTPLFRYERLLTSWPLSSVLRHEERERHIILNHSILTKLKHSAHLVVFKILVGRDLQNSMVRLQLLNTIVLTQLQLSTWPKSTPNWTGPSRVSNWRLFQNTHILRPSLPGMASFTLQFHFLSGVYYDNYDCNILCAWA